MFKITRLIIIQKRVTRMGEFHGDEEEIESEYRERRDTYNEGKYENECNPFLAMEEILKISEEYREAKNAVA